MTEHNEEEWGPWISHTPGPCPVMVGVYIMIDAVKPWSGEIITLEGVVSQENTTHEVWYSYGDGVWGRITRYRIKKPKGLKILEEILENLPETQNA